jgi:fermentation-respiration switch protein FrsA (DUF1100 family)
MRRLLLGMLYLLAGAYLALLLVGAFLSDRLMFLPQPSSYRDDASITKLHPAGGATISAIYLPNPQAKYTILLGHGNAEDIGDLRPLLAELHDSGFAVLAYDYEGYGTSEGTPGEKAAYRDIDAAYDYLTREAQVAPAHIILLGRSVGAGPAVDLAARQPVGGLIVQSGFTSAFRVLTRVRLLPFDRFNNLAKIGRVRCPVLIMHGRSDRVIAFWHGERLFAAAPEPKQAFWVAGADHNDFEYVAGERYFQAVRDFAAHLGAHPGG